MHHSQQELLLFLLLCLLLSSQQKELPTDVVLAVSYQAEFLFSHHRNQGLPLLQFVLQKGILMGGLLLTKKGL